MLAPTACFNTQGFYPHYVRKGFKENHDRFSLRLRRRSRLSHFSRNARNLNELTTYSSLNMWSILLDGIIHRNPLLSLFCCFSSFSLLQFPFLLESFDWHVSHHLIPSMTQVSFCTTMLHTVSHASFELFFPGQPLLCFAYSFDVVNSFECMLYVS